MALPLEDEDTEGDEQDMSTASSSAPIPFVAQNIFDAPPQSSHEPVAELSTDELHTVKYSDRQLEHRRTSSSPSLSSPPAPSSHVSGE